MTKPRDPPTSATRERGDLPEASYRLLFDAVADPILVATEEGRYIDANDPAVALTGYTREQLRELRLNEILVVDPDWGRAELESLRATGSWRGELDLLRKDGRLVPVEANATRLMLSEGPVITAVLRDLTPRQQAALQQQQREAQMRLITDAMPVLISYIDTEHRYRFANKAHENWFQRPRRRLLGERLADVAGDAVYATLRPWIERALAGERVDFEATVPMAYGPRFIAASFVPHRGPDDAILGCFALINDLTERKRAEDTFRFLSEASEVLAGSLDFETTLRQLAELAVPRLADACVVDILDDQGELRRVAVASVDLPKAAWVWDVAETPLDRAAPYGPARVLRSGESELIADVTDEQLVQAARNPTHLAYLRRARLVSQLVVPLRTRNRTLGTLSFITSRSGRRLGAADQTLAEELARRAALAVDNARLYQAAQTALRVRDEFLSSVTHDLRTPLTSVKGRAQLLLRRLQRGDVPPLDLLRESLAVVESTTERMTGLVDELVDLGRLESGHPLELQRSPTDLVALAQKVVKEHQRNAPAHRILVTGDDEVTGAWDAPRLERVLSNLLSNAVRYSPGGGEVRVTVMREGEVAVVRVQDQGVGIPAADLPQIFERFHRGANVAGRIAGAGIGLAGVKQIIEQHHGTVTADSVEGKGTIMTVRLSLDG